MRFTVLALFVGRSWAMRPERAQATLSNKFHQIGDALSKASGPQDSLVALKEASGVLDGILAESKGPADDHISDDDAALLRSVIDLVEKTIYSSMDSAHQADVDALNQAVAASEACNADIAARQAPSGDLGTLHKHAQDGQAELDRLQGIVDEKTQANATAYADLASHMDMIAPAPDCPDFPLTNERTQPKLDIYFESSEYDIWYAAQQSAYTAVRDVYVAADEALTAAIHDYNLQKAVRDVQYCDWKNELIAACNAFDACVSDANSHYTDELVPRVTQDMNARIEVKKAGDTVIHQINFLLGGVAVQETPEIDTSRYEIEFPALPAKGLCDQSPLEADEWVPTVECAPVGDDGMGM